MMGGYSRRTKKTMRLIDADTLRKEMYRKSFEVDDGRQRWDSGLWIRYKIFEEAEEDAPTVDAVPVIRCKDCIYSKLDDDDILTCINEDIHVQEDCFCWWAERRDDETD